MKDKVFIPDLIRSAQRGQKITMLTAYDFTFAKLLDAAGVDILLVGDSLGSVVQGSETTLPVTLDEMIYHSKCVVRGASRSLVVADMPFMSYQLGVRDALVSAGRLVKEAGVSAVKIEGGVAVAETIRAITSADIPVMGHVGLTPQSYHRMGGHRVQGKVAADAELILKDAMAVEEAGAFSVVLEGVPSKLAKQISESLSIPTIGIGAGADCDGQVLVCHDFLGITPVDESAPPKFVKQFASLRSQILDAAVSFVEEVRSGEFPDSSHSYQGKRKAKVVRASSRR